MNDSIRTLPLGEVCEILDKKRKPITKRNRVPGPYPYYGATGILDYVDDYIFDEPLVLIGEDGAKWDAGERTAYSVDGKCWVNNHAHVVRPNPKTLLDSWLIYYLNMIDLAPFITGLTVPKLNQGKLREISIPTPPLPEQKRIVAILDEAFAGINTAIANTEKNLANARELFESYLTSIFQVRSECKRVLLEELLSKQPRNGWSPPAKNHAGAGTPVLKLSSVTGFTFRPEKIKYTSAEVDTSRHYWLEEGALLMTRSNTPDLVGHVAIVSGLKESTIYPDLIMKMVVDQKKALSEFLYYQLRSPALRREITGRAQGANPNMKKIGKRAVQTLPILLFPIEQQKKVVSKSKEINDQCVQLEKLYNHKLFSSQELKQSLLQKAFSGKLTTGKAASGLYPKEEVA